MIGGGIVGRTAALAAQRAGFSVTLCWPQERDPEDISFGDAFVGPASFGNAGHIATEQVSPLATPSFLFSAPRRLFRFGGALDLGWRRPGAWLPWSLRFVRATARASAGERALSFLLSDALPAWKRLADTLDAPFLVDDRGHLAAWQNPNAWRKAARRPLRTGTARATPMPEDTLQALSGRLRRPLAGGLRFENTGQVADPVRCLRALLDAFTGAGGLVVRQAVSRLSDDARVATLANGETIEAGRIVLAAGVGTARLLRGLGRSLPLIAERGYHLEWRHDAPWPFPPLVFEERALIVSCFGDRLRASSFVEFDREDAPPDRRKWARLEEHVRALGLPVASPFRRWMGARPTLPDYLPAIGPLPGLPNLLVLSGHGHLGLTLAPRTAEIALSLLRGEMPDGLGPFDPARFGGRR
ncbi:FAD-binding oxidoreductase [Acetobacteraceae bacterium KSS8]|uniref:FAD-binding oxidoreductase n=1 Tax=Endosaccharibacter trunci TaxID=2812733 RepID=A0ABT1W6R5_9PROT|nr:FAD-binding oxidoreductase [Acetobacteraceae bacterium KSS8]